MADNGGFASGTPPLDENSSESGKLTPATLSERVLTLFQQLQRPVFRYLLRKTRNAGTAEDLTQETFLRLCRHLRAERPAFVDDVGRPRIESLRCLYGSVDPVLHRMTQLVLPSLQDPHSFCALFLDYFRLLFCAHIARTYAPSFEVIKRFSGGLAPWQKRRVTELFREHLDGTLRLTTLADECGLSVSHFARSFRRTFGTSAHRYLILQRVEMAKTLLSTSDRSLSDVALEAGFSDQAAFSRTFKVLVGTSPGQWKREAVHRPRVFQNTVFAA